MRQCNILIADDELLARQAIKLALPENAAINIVAGCGDGAEAISMIKLHLPDVIFLDVQMPLHNGFEVLGALPGNYDPYLIIVHQSALFLNSPGEPTASVVAFNVRHLDQVLGQHLSGLGLRVLHRLLCVQDVKDKVSQICLNVID